MGDDINNHADEFDEKPIHKNNTVIHTNNSTNKNVTTGNIIVTQSAPSSVYSGDPIKVTWTVRNNYSTTITNVMGVDQSNTFNFSTLSPGQTKITSFEIPSTMNMYENYTSNSTSLFIGGFSLEYDLDGKHYQVNSNNLTVNII